MGSPLCEGKIALVTGGARGIGRAISVHLALEGATVLLVDILDDDGEKTSKAIRDKGGNADYLSCDITDSKQVEHVVAETVSRFGRLDALINNAGMGVTGPFTELAESDFDRIVAINLKGSFLFQQTVIRQMLLQDTGGSIVNIASVGAVVGTPEFSLYTMTKHGLLGLTKSLAVEYAARGIRINAVCPGPVLTDMAKQLAREQGLDDPNSLAIEQRVPMERLGKPSEVAEAVVWLCSDRSSNTTGSSLFVDGGYTAQ